MNSKREQSGFPKGMMVLLAVLLGLGAIVAFLIDQPVTGIVMAVGAVGVPLLWPLSKPKR